MGDDTVRLRTHNGADEVNCRGVSYKVRWGVVNVPAEDVGPLLHVAGFYQASADDESAEHSSLSDVEAAVWSLPPGKVRSTLLMLITNTNAMNYVIQSARPNIRIV
jgi:hypothetical protein